MRAPRRAWLLILLIAFVAIACGGPTTDESATSAGRAGIAPPPPRPGAGGDGPVLELRAAPSPAASDAPRAVAPLSGARVRSVRPELRCAGAATRVEVCADPACERVRLDAPVAEGEARLASDLPRGRSFWRCVGAGAASPAWPLVVRPSPAAPRRARTGDLTGDGRADVLVGFTRGPPPFDVARLFGGTDGGLASAPVRELPSSALAGGRAGHHARRLDADGDGYEDVVTGQTLFLGGRDGLGARGEALPGDARALATGDVNGDGMDDVVLGRPYADVSVDPARGALVIVHGRARGPAPSEPATLAHVDEARRLFGAELAVVGDVDADGFDDVVASSELTGTDPAASLTKSMDVRLFRGSSEAPGLAMDRSLALPHEGNTVSLASRTEPGGWPAQWIALEALGDVDRDGFDDFAVLERGPEAEGVSSYRVSFFFGGARALRRAAMLIEPTRAAVFAVGDVDGDGAADVWVDGRILFGCPGFPEGARSFPLPAERLSVVGPGDVDGDGYGDVVVARGRALRVVFGSSGFASPREASLEDTSAAPTPSILSVWPAWVD